MLLRNMWWIQQNWEHIFCFLSLSLFFAIHEIRLVIGISINKPVIPSTLKIRWKLQTSICRAASTMNMLACQQCFDYWKVALPCACERLYGSRVKSGHKILSQIHIKIFQKLLESTRHQLQQFKNRYYPMQLGWPSGGKKLWSNKVNTCKRQRDGKHKRRACSHISPTWHGGLSTN